MREIPWPQVVVGALAAHIEAYGIACEEFVFAPVQARLGHASATETLDTYSHLWPDSDDRTRQAVDSVLLADYPRTDSSAETKTSRSQG